jgi:hypothetical protein
MIIELCTLTMHNISWLHSGEAIPPTKILVYRWRWCFSPMLCTAEGLVSPHILRNCGGTDRCFIFIPTRRTRFRLTSFFDSFPYFSSLPDSIFLLLLNIRLKLAKLVKNLKEDACGIEGFSSVSAKLIWHALVRFCKQMIP